MIPKHTVGFYHETFLTYVIVIAYNASLGVLYYKKIEGIFQFCPIFTLGVVLSSR